MKYCAKIAFILFVCFSFQSLFSQGWRQINPQEFNQVRGFRAFDYHDGDFEIYVWNYSKGFTLDGNNHFDSTFVYWRYLCNPWEWAENYLIDIAKPFNSKNLSYMFYLGSCFECASYVYSDTTGNSANQNQLISFDDFSCAGTQSKIVTSYHNQEKLYFTFRDSVYFSSDAGLSIIPLSSPDTLLDSPSLTGIFLSPYRENEIFTTGYSNGSMVYKSIDGGIEWFPVAQAAFHQLEFHPSDSLKVYAAAEEGLFVSNDGGISWDLTESGVFLAIEIDNQNSDTLFAGTQTGELFISTDSGQTWALYNNTFSNYGILGIYKQNNNDSLIVATWDGIFRVYDSFLLDIDDNAGNPVHDFHIKQNYPNPFNPTTKIEYEIGFITQVDLVVFNSIGQEVQTLVSEKQHPGKYTVEFNAKNLPAGVYYLKIRTSRGSLVKKATFLK